jgi:hypothetical protein
MGDLTGWINNPSPMIHIGRRSSKPPARCVRPALGREVRADAALIIVQGIVVTGAVLPGVRSGTIGLVGIDHPVEVATRILRRNPAHVAPVVRRDGTAGGDLSCRPRVLGFGTGPRDDLAGGGLRLGDAVGGLLPGKLQDPLDPGTWTLQRRSVARPVGRRFASCRRCAGCGRVPDEVASPAAPPALRRSRRHRHRTRSGPGAG